MKILKILILNCKKAKHINRKVDNTKTKTQFKKTIRLNLKFEIGYDFKKMILAYLYSFDPFLSFMILLLFSFSMRKLQFFPLVKTYFRPT